MRHPVDQVAFLDFQLGPDKNNEQCSGHCILDKETLTLSTRARVMVWLVKYLKRGKKSLRYTITLLNCISLVVIAFLKLWVHKKMLKKVFCRMSISYLKCNQGFFFPG